MDTSDKHTDDYEINKLKKLFDEMVQEMNDTEIQQQSLRSDFIRNQFVNYHENAREFGDRMFLRLNSN